MPDNVENVQENAQENSENTENIQQESEIETENTEKDTSETPDAVSEGEKAETSSSDDEELPLPDPDITDEEIKKKKEQPEWMKKRLEREKRKEQEKQAAQSAETERLRLENLALRNGQNPNQQQPPAAPPGVDPYMPQRDQYNNDGEYFIALSDYREQRRSQVAEHMRRQEAIQKHETEFKNKLQEAIDSGKEKYKDFDERTDYILYGDGFPSNRAMAEAIVDSEYKDDILYFLGTNIKEAERIANSNPIQAAKDIAKLEVRFASRKKSNITKAPPPLKPVTGGKGSATHGNPEKMAPDEFRQWYKDKFG